MNGLNPAQLRKLARIVERFPILDPDFVDTRPRDAEGALVYRRSGRCPNCGAQHTHGGWSGHRLPHCGAAAWDARVTLIQLGLADLADLLDSGIEGYVLVEDAE